MQASTSDTLLVARHYCAMFLRKGTVGYDDGVYYIRAENLEKIATKHLGIPVVMEHQEVTPDNINNIEVGRVVRVFVNNGFVNPLNGETVKGDGDYWCEMIITNSKAANLLDSGYGVSNHYAATVNAAINKQDPEYANVDIVAEITDGTPNHLAIVKEPRYNTAKTVTLLNSKPKSLINFSTMQKVKQAALNMISNKKINNTVDDKEAVHSNENADATHEVVETETNPSMPDYEIDGIKYSEMLNSIREHYNTLKYNAEMEEFMNGEDEIDGQMMSRHDIANMYRELQQNAIKNSNETKEAEEKE